MSLKILTTAALAAILPLTLAFTPRANSVRFSVENGTKLEKELAISATFTMEGGTAYMMGEEEEIPPEDEPLEIDVSMEVTDDFQKVEDGHPVELLRTFDTMVLEFGAGDDGGEVDEFTDLEGATVKFVRGEGGEYEKSFHEKEEDEDLLPGLEADMDFLALLPEDEVSEGDEWKVSGAGLKTVFLPGGIPFKSGAEESIGSVIADLAVPMLADGAEDFEITCTYKGARESDDSRIAEIVIEFEGSTSGEASEIVLAIAEIAGESEGAPDDIMADVDVDFSGEGTLLWDLEGGHVHAYECTVSTDIGLAIEFSQDFGGDSMEMSFEIELAGDIEWELSVSE